MSWFPAKTMFFSHQFLVWHIQMLCIYKSAVIRDQKNPIWNTCINDSFECSDECNGLQFQNKFSKALLTQLYLLPRVVSVYLSGVPWCFLLEEMSSLDTENWKLMTSHFILVGVCTEYWCSQAGTISNNELETHQLSLHLLNFGQQQC